MSGLFRFAATVPRICIRKISMTGVRNRKMDPQMMAKQELYQTDDNVPIYLKEGTNDYVLFFGTVSLVVIGFVSSMHSLYKLATRK